jgi:hypothetical protein
MLLAFAAADSNYWCVYMPVNTCEKIPECTISSDGLSCEAYSTLPKNATAVAIRAELQQLQTQITAGIEAKIGQEGAYKYAENALHRANVSATIVPTLVNDLTAAKEQIKLDEAQIERLQDQVAQLEKQLFSIPAPAPATTPPVMSAVALMQESSGSWCQFMPLNDCTDISGCALSSDGSSCVAFVDPQATAATNALKGEITTIDTQIQGLIGSKIQQEGMITYAQSKLASSAGLAADAISQLKQDISSAQTQISADEAKISLLGAQEGNLHAQLQSQSNFAVNQGSGSVPVATVLGVSTLFALVGFAAGWKGRERRSQTGISRPFFSTPAGQELQAMGHEQAPSYSSTSSSGASPASSLSANTGYQTGASYTPLL